MKKALLIIVLLIVISLPAHAVTYYWVRADGIYSSMDRNGNLQPTVMIGDSMKSVGSKFGRTPDGGLSDGVARFMDNGQPGTFWGLTLYGYNILLNTGFQNLSKQETIKSIEVFNPEIRTLKGVGVGCTCKQIWDAHGTSCITQSLNRHDVGFYYTVNGHYIYFVVTSTDHLDDNFQVSSIIIF